MKRFFAVMAITVMASLAGCTGFAEMAETGHAPVAWKNTYTAVEEIACDNPVGRNVDSVLLKLIHLIPFFQDWSGSCPPIQEVSNDS